MENVQKGVLINVGLGQLFKAAVIPFVPPTERPPELETSKNNRNGTMLFPIKVRLNLKDDGTNSEPGSDPSVSGASDITADSSSDDEVLGALARKQKSEWQSCSTEMPKFPFTGFARGATIVKEPIQYLSEYLPDKFLENYCYESNLYIRSKNPNDTFVLRVDDLKGFLSCCYYMALFDMTRTRRNPNTTQKNQRNGASKFI